MKKISVETSSKEKPKAVEGPKQEYIHVRARRGQATDSHSLAERVHFQQDGREWKKMKRSSASDWDRNLEAVVQWSPFSSESDLLKQFDHMKEQGTRIIIYNLWEDDQQQLELDIDTDKHVR
ncbi:hypothetical protein Hdeb2414_s0005g00168381 [Helianthus debilis subsp. tardiflorus]